MGTRSRPSKYSLEILMRMEISQRHKHVSDRPEFQIFPKLIQERLQEFVRTEIPKVEFFKPDGKPEKNWLLFSGPTWFDAIENARHSAGDKKRASNYYDALYAADDEIELRYGKEAMTPVRFMALHAIWEVAMALPDIDKNFKLMGGVIELQQTAGLVAEYILMSDIELPGKQKHQEYVDSIWKPWVKGYGMYCDIGGKFYTYCKDPGPNTIITLAE